MCVILCGPMTFSRLLCSVYVSFIDWKAGLQKLEAYIILWKQTKRTNIEYQNMKRKRAHKAPGLQHPKQEVVAATNKNKLKKTN